MILSDEQAKLVAQQLLASIAYRYALNIERSHLPALDAASFRLVADWLVFGGEALVDAATHAADGVDVPALIAETRHGELAGQLDVFGGEAT